MNDIKSATYDVNRFFWINSGEEELLIQPQVPKRFGINQIERTDTNGQYIFGEFITHFSDIAPLPQHERVPAVHGRPCQR